MKVLKILLLLALMMLLLSACMPAAHVGDVTGQNAMTVIYNLTFSTVKNAWVIAGWIVGIFLACAVGFAVYRAKDEDGRAGLIAAVLTALVLIGGFYFLSNSYATSDATHALETGSARAQTRKANQYMEKLEIPATKAVYEVRKCTQSDYGSGCRYEWTYDYNFHQVCTTTTTTDSEGHSHTSTSCHEEWDTMHVPYFTQEVRTSAYFSMPDKYLVSKVCDDAGKCEDAGTNLVKSKVANMPMRVYTDWQAPENYSQYWYGNDHRYNKVPPTLASFGYKIPGEWKAIDKALNSGRPYMIAVPHAYVNWVFASDHNNLVAQSTRIAQYMDAGLLPTMNKIYSRYGTSDKRLWQDTDFVQFSGIDPGDKNAWEDAAMLYSLNVGPKLQGSLLVWFVPADKVDSLDQLINAAKAHLSDRDTFGFYMAPKNLVLIGCAVDPTKNMITACRAETGMPTGNAAFENAISKVKNVPFSVQGVFGTMQPKAVKGKDGFYTSTLPVPTDGMLSIMFDPNYGFVREHMASMQWLQTDVHLDAPDIQWTVDTETARARSSATWVALAGILLAIGICLIGAAEGEGGSRRYSGSGYYRY